MIFCDTDEICWVLLPLKVDAPANALFSISRLVSGPDLINLIRRGRDASREAIAERIMIMAATL
jgi:hypothetical protein